MSDDDACRMQRLESLLRTADRLLAGIQHHAKDCNQHMPCSCGLDDWRMAVQPELRVSEAPTPTPPAAERWGWMVPQSESAYGPFASERLAIEDASREIGEPDVLIHVGLCEPFEPHLWVGAIGDVDDITQRMEEFAADNEWWIEDQVIEAEDGAEEALHAMLHVWAKRYLTSKHWQLKETEPPHAKTVDPTTLRDPT